MKNDCFFCGENKTYIILDYTNIYMELIKGNRLEIDANNTCKDIEINFCPFCGKQLKAESKKGYEIGKK